MHCVFFMSGASVRLLSYILDNITHAQHQSYDVTMSCVNDLDHISGQNRKAHNREI